jgi:hypothetical protein
MQAVTSFHPNRFYFTTSGTLVYLLSTKNNGKEGLGVVVGPILAAVRDWDGYLESKILSNVKIVHISTSVEKGCVEINLPKRITNRIYIALKGMAELFAHFSESIDPYVVTLNYSANALSQEMIDQINEELKDKKGMWLASPQNDFFEYLASFVFEDEKSMDKFSDALERLDKKT